MIALANQQDKILRFYQLDSFLENGDDAQLIGLYRNWKKISCLTSAGFDKASGLLIGDKVGEIKFINTNNISKLPTKIEDLEIKLNTEHNDDQMNELVKSIPYGHQQEVTSIIVSSCGRYLICTDTLNKLIVTNWPNVCNIQSVNTD